MQAGPCDHGMERSTLYSCDATMCCMGWQWLPTQQAICTVPADKGCQPTFWTGGYTCAGVRSEALCLHSQLTDDQAVTVTCCSLQDTRVQLVCQCALGFLWHTFMRDGDRQVLGTGAWTEACHVAFSCATMCSIVTAAVHGRVAVVSQCQVAPGWQQTRDV